MPQGTIPIHPVVILYAGPSIMGSKEMPVDMYEATHRDAFWNLYKDSHGEWYEDCVRCAHASVDRVCTWCANERTVRLASSEIGVKRALRVRNETDIVAQAHAGRVRQIERWAHANPTVACGLAYVRTRQGPYANAGTQLVSLSLHAVRAPLNTAQTILACALLSDIEAGA